MLITNFAAGELSKTLFGRVDLPQYYNGAARMENFDVIPTGGMRRRGGTERLYQMFTEPLFQMFPERRNGRLIPFMVDRDLGFLLHLIPLHIWVYKFKKFGRLAGEYESDLGFETSEINDVQYARNYDTMILCHENHPPLEVKLKLSTETLEIKAFGIDIGVDVQRNDKVQTVEESDALYSKEKWLRGRGEWPRCATFFVGRLIFAGTLNNRQRLFVSSVENTQKFATYKKFITAEKKYIYADVRFKINEDEVELLSPGDIGKFTKPPNQYTINSAYFLDGASVSGLANGKLKIKRAGDIKFNDIEMQQFLEWKDNIESSDIWFPLEVPRLIPYGEITFRREVWVPFRPGTGQNDPAVSAHWELDGSTKNSGFIQYKKTGKCQLLIKQEHTFNFPTQEPESLQINKSFNLDDPEQYVTSKNNFYDFVVNSLDRLWREAYPQTIPEDVKFEKIKETIENQDAFVNDFYTQIQTAMHYPCVVMGVSLNLYGTPDHIYRMILSNFKDITVTTSIAFCTIEIIAEDSYPTPDCGFTFEIASDTNDAINWLVVNKGLIVGTESGEWIIPPDVHATNIRATLNSRYGSDKIQGTAVGDATCFFQAGKKSLVEYYIPQQDNNFRANNMAMLVPEMLSESPALEFDYISSPHTKLLITREDGTMAALLYERGTGTFAWSRITTAGKIKSGAVLPGPDGNDDAYLLVERGGDFYLERLRDPADGEVYLDSWTRVNAASWAAVRQSYQGDGVGVCRVFTDADGIRRHEALDAGATPDFTQDGDFYIGYKYASVLRTMPVLDNNQMKKQNIVNLIFRFLESYALKMTSIVGGKTKSSNDIRNFEPPYSGIKKASFPGNWDEEVQAELSTDAPAPVTVLALNAEMAQPYAK